MYIVLVHIVSLLESAGIWSCWSDCHGNILTRYCVKPEYWLNSPEQSPLQLGVLRSAPNAMYVSNTCPEIEPNSLTQMQSGEQLKSCPPKPAVLPPEPVIQELVSTGSPFVTTTPDYTAQPRIGQALDQQHGSDVKVSGSLIAATQSLLADQTPEPNDSLLLMPLTKGASKLTLILIVLLVLVFALFLLSLFVICVLLICYRCKISSPHKNRRKSSSAAAHNSSTSSSETPSTPTSRTSSGEQHLQLIPSEAGCSLKAQSPFLPNSGAGDSRTLQNGPLGISFRMQALGGALPQQEQQLVAAPMLSRQVSSTSQSLGDRRSAKQAPTSPVSAISPGSLDDESTLEHPQRSNDFNMALLSSFEHGGGAVAGRPNGALGPSPPVAILTSAAMAVPQPESPSHNYYNFASPAHVSRLNSRPADPSGNIPEQPPLLQSLKLPNSVQPRARLGTHSTFRSSTTSDVDDLQSLSEMGSQHSKLSPYGPTYPLQSTTNKLLNRLSPQISIDADESDHGSAAAAPSNLLAKRRHTQQGTGQKLPRLLLASQQPSLAESPLNEEVPVTLAGPSQSMARSPVPRSPLATFAPGSDPATFQAPSSNGTWTTNSTTVCSEDSAHSPLLPSSPTASVPSASTPLYAGLRQLGGSGRAANDRDVESTAHLLASPTQSEAPSHAPQPQVNGGQPRLTSFSGVPQGGVAGVAVPGARHVYEKSVSYTPSHETAAAQTQQFTFNPPVEQRNRRLTGVAPAVVAQRPEKRTSRGPSVSSNRTGLEPPDSARSANAPNESDDVFPPAPHYV